MPARAVAVRDNEGLRPRLANTPGLKVLKVIFNGFFNVEDGPTDNMHGGGPGGDTPTMSIS